MPGPILHLGATVTCSHGGQALPTAPNPRALVSGQPVATQATVWTIAGCGFVPPGGNVPCVTGTFVTAAARVFAGGVPVVLMDGVSTCAPTGTPMIPVQAQTRVMGS
jgi:hypothetical protein